MVILTAGPLVVPEVKRFVPRKTQLNAKFGVADKPAVLKGKWCAHPDYRQGEQKTFLAEHRFTLDAIPEKSHLSFSVDDEVKVCVNGTYLADTFRDHRVIFRKNLCDLLKKGKNIVRFEITNFSGPTGLVYDLTCDAKTVSSGKDTLFSIDGGKSWQKAHVFGRQPCAPWGRPRLMIFDR